MTVPARAATPARGFYAVAHRAGNNLHQVEQALEARADAIECDLWHARGKLALRHERKLPALPVLFDKWYLRFAWGQLSLRRLLKEINFRAELYLDIKSSTPRAADAVLSLYNDHSAMMPPTSVSSRQWKLLDRIARAGTSMSVFYSAQNNGDVESLLRRAQSGEPPAGISIRHTLLTPQRLEELHLAGMLVYAWTVNMEDRARDLVAWGVDGIISDDPQLFDKVAQ